MTPRIFLNGNLVSYDGSFEAIFKEFVRLELVSVVVVDPLTGNVQAARPEFKIKYDTFNS